MIFDTIFSMLAGRGAALYASGGPIIWGENASVMCRCTHINTAPVVQKYCSRKYVKKTCY